MNNQAAQTMPELRELARRAVPFLRDEGSNYEDDGNNEPLELARAIEAALAGNPNRDAANPGGCECEKCGRVFIGAEWHVLCGICIDHGVAQPDGSGLRNGENVPASTPEASPQPQVANPAYTAMLPELPDQDVDTERGDYYSMAAMEAYGRACYAAALSQTAGVAEGWKLVPLEPTPQMLIPLVHRKWDQQWERGKRMQSEQLHRSTVEGNYGYQDWMIPPKTEYEQAAGQYIEMLERAPTPPEAPAASGGEVEPYAFSESRREHEAACRDRMNVSGVFKAEPPAGASVSDPIAALRDKWATRSGSLTYDLAAVELDTALEQALTQQRGECEDAHKFRRLAQLLDGFDFRLGRNALMPPATYLDSVEITCEFQPGIGQSVIDAIVDVLATEKRND